MTSLLNKFAWFLSLIFGILIVSIFSDSPSGYNFIEEVFFIFFWGLILGGILKTIFFSRSFIASRIEYFGTTLISRQDTPTIIKEEAHEHDNNTVIEEKSSPETLQGDSGKISYQSPNYAFSKDDKNIIDDIKITPKEDSVVIKAIKEFFSENILAKIGGLLVFLGVLFLLSLVWDYIPGVLKIILGFIIGMSVYGAGIFLDKKGIVNESRILLGFGILVNYAVILSGRYIIGDSNLEISPVNQNVFGVGITFFFLILNTIFAVMTSLLYKSRVLLVFSLIFAYLNPLLIGGSSDTPYVLLGYTLIVSAGALFLAHIQKNTFLLLITFTLGNLLIFLAPGFEEIHIVLKFLSFLLLIFGSLFSAIHTQKTQQGFVEMFFAASFLLLGLFNIVFGGHNTESIILYHLMLISTLCFLFLSYLYSKKWSYLYTIGTIGSALFIGSIAQWTSVFIIPSSIAVIIFAILNICYPFTRVFSDAIQEKNIKHFVLGSVSGILFIGFELFVFGQDGRLSQMEQGFSFFALAIVYFFIGYIFLQKHGIENIKKDLKNKNTLYTFLAISTSLFSLSIAYVFSQYPQIISIVWLFEATIIFYFYSKTQDIKMYLAALVLFILGIGNLFQLVGTVQSGDYIFFVPSLFIGISLIINLKNLKDITSPEHHIFHDIFHLLGVVALSFFIIEIVPFTGHGWNVFAMAIFFNILSYIYAKIGSRFLHYALLFMNVLLYFFHIGEFESIAYRLGRDGRESLMILQYITTGLLGSAVYIFLKNNTQKSIQIGLQIALALYLFIITSMYIYDIFNNTFAVTMYWGAIAFLLMHIGVQKDIIKLRTLGLYLIAIMCLKIFFIDIGSSGYEAPIKVIAFIGVGVMLIIISTMYSKKYGNNLKGEFQLSNLIRHKNNSQETQDSLKNK